MAKRKGRLYPQWRAELNKAREEKAAEVLRVKLANAEKVAAEASTIGAATQARVDELRSQLADAGESPADASE